YKSAPGRFPSSTGFRGKDQRGERPTMNATGNASRRTAWPLLFLSLGLTLLSIFQWAELFVLRSGGKTVCGINATINCETVWNWEAASRIHALSGMPLAGLGLVYALTALTLSVRLLLRLKRGLETRPVHPPLWLTALIGMVCVVLFAA